MVFFFSALDVIYNIALEISRNGMREFTLLNQILKPKRIHIILGENAIN